MTKARILVTRFAPDALRLANLLNSHGVFAYPQPLQAIRKTVEFSDISCVVTNNYDFIIALSRNAALYTKQALAENSWPVTVYLAVGHGTQAELHKATGQKVMIPNVRFDSEGLLALPCLAKMQGKRVLILRGYSGRELLAEILKKRGAYIDYYQPYQRIAVDLNGQYVVNLWQQKEINAALITSVELLQRLIDIVPQAQHNWLKKITIYAPSKRITDKARLLGWCNAKKLPGMRDEQIVDYFN